MVNNERQTPLHLLISSFLKQDQKDLITVTEFIGGLSALIDAMFSVNTQDKRGNTPLHLITASSKGANDTSPIYLIAQKLLKKSAKLDLQNKDGFTPLHNAVLQKNLPLVRLLLKNGANPHIRSYKPRTIAQIHAQVKLEPNKTALDMANEILDGDPVVNQIKFALEDAMKAQPAPRDNSEPKDALSSSLNTVTKSLGSLKNLFSKK